MLIALLACFGTPDVQDSDPWTDADADTDADTDTDADSDAPYANLAATLTNEFSTGSANPGSPNCHIEFRVLGTAVDTCPDCLFAFSLDSSTELEANTVDDGTYEGCDASLAPFADGWGFTEDYQGYGPYVMYQVEGDWRAQRSGEHTGDTLSWSQGYVDYYYDGLYYSSFRGVTATLTR